ncbi:MAG: hypothetical protein WCM76_01520 [Bacteroidota bacterium]
MRKISFSFSFLIVLSLLVISVPGAIAQQKQDLYKPDARLYQCLDKAFLDKLQSEKSELIIYYNYYLENCYYTTPLNGDKPVEGIDIHTVTVKDAPNGAVIRFKEKTFNKSTFNPMKYNFNFGMGVFTTYTWKEAGIAIVCRSTEAISTGYKAYLSSLEITK